VFTFVSHVSVAFPEHVKLWSPKTQELPSEGLMWNNFWRLSSDHGGSVGLAWWMTENASTSEGTSATNVLSEKWPVLGNQVRTALSFFDDESNAYNADAKREKTSEIDETVEVPVFKKSKRQDSDAPTPGDSIPRKKKPSDKRFFKSGPPKEISEAVDSEDSTVIGAVSRAESSKTPGQGEEISQKVQTIVIRPAGKLPIKAKEAGKLPIEEWEAGKPPIKEREAGKLPIKEREVGTPALGIRKSGQRDENSPPTIVKRPAGKQPIKEKEAGTAAQSIQKSGQGDENTAQSTAIRPVGELPTNEREEGTAVPSLNPLKLQASAESILKAVEALHSALTQQEVHMRELIECLKGQSSNDGWHRMFLFYT
jgi:hypothetical protein